MSSHVPTIPPAEKGGSLPRERSLFQSFSFWAVIAVALAILIPLTYRNGPMAVFFSIITLLEVVLLFNVLITASPKELAGDVGSLRGVTQNLAAAVGTSLVGTLLVGILSSIIVGGVVGNPVISAELKDELNLTNLNNAYYFAALGGGHIIPAAGRGALMTTNFRF